MRSAALVQAGAHDQLEGGGWTTGIPCVFWSSAAFGVSHHLGLGHPQTGMPWAASRTGAVATRPPMN